MVVNTKDGSQMPNSGAHTKYTLAEWRAKAAELFGDDFMKWKFVCPVCEHVATSSSGRTLELLCNRLPSRASVAGPV